MIFVDAGAWIAISNPRDQHHREAMEIYRDFQFIGYCVLLSIKRL